MDTLNKYHKVIFLIILLFCGVIYSVGINGPFLYDDISNLSPLSQFVENDLLESARKFIFGNHSGPLGRPVSLASFFLNSQTWPTEPAAFKISNIILHLLCGSLIFLLIQQLILKIEPLIAAKTASYIALVTASFWLLHPLHVSTTLYVVQRMSQLSALFSLLTMIIFLRYLPSLHNSKKIQAFIWPTIIIVVLISLAVFSKENALLIFPALILTNSFCAKKHHSRLYSVWFFTLTILPTLICIYWLYSSSSYFASTYEYRGFTLTERLLTELRIVTDYLFQILLPNSNSMSIFHDDFELSRSLLNPISTLFSFVLIVGLVLLLFSKIRPVYKFSIAWFFLWHLLESTTIPLYLYFEHRNYIASLGPLLALSYGINHLFETKLYKHNKLQLIITTMISIVFTFQLALLTKLWSNEESLLTHWLTNHEKSQETLISFVQYYENQNNLQLAYNITSKAVEFEAFNDDLAVNLKLFNQQCILHEENNQLLDKLVRLSLNPDNYSLSVLHMSASITLSILAGKCKPDNVHVLHTVFTQIRDNAPQKINPLWVNDMQLKHAYIYWYYNNLSEALVLFKKSFASQPDVAIAVIDINIRLSNFTEAKEWISVADRLNIYHKNSVLDKSAELKILKSRIDAHYEQAK